MSSRFRRMLSMGLSGLAAMTIIGALATGGWSSPAAQSKPAAGRLPQYGKDRALMLPADYRQWVFVGSSLGLSYSEGAAGHEMFHETLLEPTAYAEFVRTGTFREGTMLVLMLHATGESVLPGRRGRFAADVHGVEMAVKDRSRVPEGWAYYNFGGMGGLRDTAQPMPKAACYDCHKPHAARDNVFLQFYPLLAEAAHIKLSSRVETEPGVRSAVAPALSETRTDAKESVVALGGLDPVLLVQGREEMGKPEIVASHRAYRYQFVSEPDRVAFAADPDRYAIQNTTCLVVPGAPIDPARFAVHEGRIYGFAMADCVKQFKEKPAAYLIKD